MTSVDELFKRSFTDSRRTKRKFEAPQDPNEAYKAAKLTNGDVTGSRHPTAAHDGEKEDSIEAGPSLPPASGTEAENDEDEDEDEGRFFGGGVDRHTRDMMDYVNAHEEEVVPEKIDSAWIRRLALSFERKISKNAELRSKFEDNPQKFMSSEADLDAEIKGLSVLTDYPELYPEFAQLGCVASVVSLVGHENTDIAIDAVQVLAELTDEDVQVEQEQWDSIADAMLEADVAELLVSQLERLDEINEADREGVYHALSLMENLASQIKASEALVSGNKLLEWILNRVAIPGMSQNKQYAAEILAILLQTSPQNRVAAMQLDVVDLLLRLLSAYRKRDPDKDSEEEEYAENLFDSLTCLVDDSEGKDKFVELEGTELCLIMLKEGKFSKQRALRLLDHAVGQEGVSVCEKLVEIGGLKTIFTTFMKQRQDRVLTEHFIGIFASMLRLLPGDSPPRIRLLAKFLEKDYEKLTRLLELRTEYAARVGPVEQHIAQISSKLSEDDRETFADEWLSQRLDAGLFTLQTIDVILAWLVAEDGGAKKRISAVISLAESKRTLQEQLEGADEKSGNADMLSTLIDFLE